MYSYLKPLMFSMSAETAHDVTIDGLSALSRLGLFKLLNQARVSDPYECMGLNFPNRVGLAAGLDKNAVAYEAFAALGFGFVEVGTVTPRPQLGNPKPRLFRVPEHKAIINRMGFNNDGVDAMVPRLARRQFDGILGVNIGKNKDTSAEDAYKDYLECLEKVYPYADYVTVNLSSPNTPGLRDLQFGDALKGLLAELKNAQLRLKGETGRYVPMTIKLAPDMAEEDLIGVANQIVEAGLDGIIATNTTIDRTAIAGHPLENEAGGLSGEVLTTVSQNCAKTLVKALDGKIPLIGVGGICDDDSAEERIKAGADLIQIYSALIYEGPGLIKECAKAVKALRDD
ncbi:MAG: quinone-dependent dihydroorotate dehydrogenase [Gammaproteobacteria bacterium]|nr:quinone-dependent dihydroorotate dehydrogenase [Gammaproteobacteria bacterium]